MSHILLDELAAYQTAFTCLGEPPSPSTDLSTDCLPTPDAGPVGEERNALQVLAAPTGLLCWSWLWDKSKRKEYLASPAHRESAQSGMRGRVRSRSHGEEHPSLGWLLGATQVLAQRVTQGWKVQRAHSCFCKGGLYHDGLSVGNEIPVNGSIQAWLILSSR